MLGQCCPMFLGEHYYNPAVGYAANPLKAPNQSLYTVGEAVAPAAAKGGVVVSNLGYAADAYLGESNSKHMNWLAVGLVAAGVAYYFMKKDNDEEVEFEAPELPSFMRRRRWR